MKSCVLSLACTRVATGQGSQGKSFWSGKSGKLVSGQGNFSLSKQNAIPALKSSNSSIPNPLICCYWTFVQKRAKLPV